MSKDFADSKFDWMSHRISQRGFRSSSSEQSIRRSGLLMFQSILNRTNCSICPQTISGAKRSSDEPSRHPDSKWQTQRGFYSVNCFYDSIWIVRISPCAHCCVLRVTTYCENTKGHLCQNHKMEQVVSEAGATAPSQSMQQMLQTELEHHTHQTKQTPQTGEIVPVNVRVWSYPLQYRFLYFFPSHSQASWPANCWKLFVTAADAPIWSGGGMVFRSSSGFYNDEHFDIERERLKRATPKSHFQTERHWSETIRWSRNVLDSIWWHVTSAPLIRPVSWKRISWNQYWS